MKKKSSPLADLMEAVVDDPALREQIEECPAAALEKAGVELNEESLAMTRGALVARKRPVPAFAPPYVPIGPVLSGDGVVGVDLTKATDATEAVVQRLTSIKKG